MRDKNEVAKLLAQCHYRTDSTLVQVVRLMCDDATEDRPDEPIKLLEVNEATVASGIVPLQFDAHPESGIDYSSVIVEVTPEEYDEIEAGRLELPNDWQIGDLLARP